MLLRASLQSLVYTESSKMVKRKQSGPGKQAKSKAENSSSVWHRCERQKDCRQESWKSGGDSSQAMRLSAHRETLWQSLRQNMMVSAKLRRKE